MLFQVLLVTTALHKPIITMLSRATWVSMVVVMDVALVITIGIGYHHNQNNASTGTDNGYNVSSEHWSMLHQRLNLLFLLSAECPLLDSSCTPTSYWCSRASQSLNNDNSLDRADCSACDQQQGQQCGPQADSRSYVDRG